MSFTKNGTATKIIEYIDARNIIVQFNDEHKYSYKTEYKCFKSGALVNPYEPKTNGIGYMGVGKYNSKKDKLAYQKWHGMLCRCVNWHSKKENFSYKDCTICPEWLDFQNFAEWFYDNYYECEEALCVDKDILVHGNRVYSPETCLLLPLRINLLFVKEKGIRGQYPIGVQMRKNAKGVNKYISTMGINNKSVHIGVFDTEIEAFNAYKKAKEDYIKQVADEYKDIIPKKVYDAMYSYEVLITD